VSLATVPGGLTVNVDGTNYAAPSSFTWATNSSHTLSAADAQVSADGHARYPFLSWSDGGAQTQTVTTSLFDTNYTATFTTEFLLDITVSPAGAGNVVPVPGGPWHPRNQSVSLTATPNPGFTFQSWSGVDSQTNNTAQAAMSGYRHVIAAFQSLGPIIIDTGSLTRLPDGRIQFGVTAGAGATQLTVWGTTSLLPPNWQILGTVPLTGGSGVFIDSPAPTLPTRFYRATVP
jgi:List-Bact-rpt repeat protein